MRHRVPSKLLKISLIVTQQYPQIEPKGPRLPPKYHQSNPGVLLKTPPGYLRNVPRVQPKEPPEYLQSDPSPQNTSKEIKEYPKVSPVPHPSHPYSTFKVIQEYSQSHRQGTRKVTKYIRFKMTPDYPPKQSHKYIQINPGLHLKWSQRSNKMTPKVPERLLKCTPVK